MVVFKMGGTNPFNKSAAWIELRQMQSGELLFTVIYGGQVDSSLTYSQACSKLGAAILHNACCDGLASNEGA